jgi:hypothetical protein
MSIALSVTLVAMGLYAVSQAGLEGILAGTVERIRGVPMAAWPALLLVATGLLMIRSGRVLPWPARTASDGR